MYEFPFGAGQQLNLNWIINEIITLHKQLDPDYELPNFDTAFPYMNLNTLNLDWILRELKAIKDLAPTEDATLLKMVANALLAETYDAATQYNVDDIVYRDNEKRLFKCITATPAGGEAWDNSKWVEIDVGEVLTDLLVNGGTPNAVTNVRYNDHKIQQEINGTYSDVIVIEDTPTNVSDRLPSSKAVYNLNGAINDINNELPVFLDNSPSGTVACNGNTFNTIATLNITPGTWAIFAYHEWQNSANQEYTLGLADITHSKELSGARNLSMLNGGGLPMVALTTVSNNAVIRYGSYIYGSTGNTARYVQLKAFRITT